MFDWVLNTPLYFYAVSNQRNIMKAARRMKVFPDIFNSFSTQLILGWGLLKNIAFSQICKL